MFSHLEKCCFTIQMTRGDDIGPPFFLEFQTNEGQGASLDEIYDWLKTHGGPATLSSKAELEKALDTEV